VGEILDFGAAASIPITADVNRRTSVLSGRAGSGRTNQPGFGAAVGPEPATDCLTGSKGDLH